MSNISVAEILKIHGKWIGSKEFVHLVSEKLKITDRHAYNLIKKASDTDKNITKITLENRTVMYGLIEFGPNESLPIANIEKGQRFGFFEWLKWRDERKDKERRICTYRVAVGRERLYLLTQFDVGDDEFTRRWDEAKTKLQKQYGLEHDYG